MPLRPLPFREVVRKLEAAGFRQVSQRGSHVKFVKSEPTGTRTAMVPRHHRESELARLGNILRQAGISALTSLNNYSMTK